MNEDQIIEAVKKLKSDVRPQDYAKIIGQMVNDGFKTKTEKPKQDIPEKWLAEHLAAFKSQGGTADQMIAALKKGGVSI
jgi:hypothetical protein